MSRRSRAAARRAVRAPQAAARAPAVPDAWSRMERMLGPGGLVERLVVGGVPYERLLRELSTAALRIAREHGDAHDPAADVFFAVGSALRADAETAGFPSLRAYCDDATRWTYDVDERARVHGG